VWGAGLAVLCAHAYTVATGRLTNGFSAYYAAARALTAGQLGAWVYDDALFTRYVQDITSTPVLEIFGPNTPSMSLLLVPLAGVSPGHARAYGCWCRSPRGPGQRPGSFVTPAREARGCHRLRSG
jgi:hypothetical protein